MLGVPLRLRCEYLSNPLGIDVTRPRLSWWVDDDRPAEIQTGYHLLAASSEGLLADDEGDLWDTGRVESQQTLNVDYQGSPLGSRQQVWWKVRSFDSDGMPSGWSAVSYFEIGLLDDEDWRARWVGVPLRGSPATPVQVPVLRRTFRLPDELPDELPNKIVSARLHITALGLYRVELNGEEISGDRLTPGWTDYRQRVRYQTYDVTAYLQRGDNAIGVLLGDGWYCGNPGLGPRQQYGERPLLCAQISVTLGSGALLIIGTDHQWKWQRSTLLGSDLVAGESVDARQFQPGWSQPGFDEVGWYPVSVEQALPVQRSATMSPPIRVHQEHSPVCEPTCHRRQYAAPRWIYDFGQTLVGSVRVRLTALDGLQLRIRYAQAVDSKGELTQPIDAGVDWYTTAGGSQGESFEPHFSLHGFRYVEIETDLTQAALSKLPAPQVMAIAVGTDLENTGHFSSDHGQLNELFDDIQRNQRARALDLPTAGIGSTRRLGQTGETRGLLSLAAFNHDVASFYAKWLDDLSDAQLDQGGFPSVVPQPPSIAGLQIEGQGGWSDAFVRCLWTGYRHFGNRRSLERHYPTLRSFVLGLASQWPDGICEPGIDQLAGNEHATPSDLNQTAMFFQTARLAARIAGVLGNLGDLEEFEELAQSIRSAFRNRFVTHDGRLVGDTDADYVLALQLGLLGRSEQRVVFNTVVARIEHRGPGAVDLLAVPYLLQVLTRGGRVDLVYEMLLQCEPGGWLERSLGAPARLWDEAGADVARVAMGAIGEWLYTGLAGLDLDGDLSESHNAFRRVKIQPRPPLGVGLVVNAYGPPIRSVSASLDTVNGHFETSWEITESAFELNVLVPCNCSAVVVMPDDSERNVASGRHRFTMPLIEASDGIPILREISEAS